MAKLMIMPSARSRYVKDDNMNLIYRLLQVTALVMIFMNWYLYGFMYGLKLFLMILFTQLVTREVEILFYSHDKNINRPTAKELISKSYYKITALIFVLMIPVGTPLWLSGVGAAIATLLGKLLFGGFHHMVFHSSLVGYIFLTEGWTALLKGVEFSTAFDNYLINLLFNNSFFNEVLYIGRIFGLDGPLFDVSSMETVLGQVTNNSVTYSLLDTMIGAVPGVLVSGILLLAFLIYLIIKKAVNYVVPVTMIGSFLLTVFLTNGFDVNVVLYHLFSGAFLFVVVFVSTDFITTPIPSIGKVIFGIVAGSLTVFIRNGANYEEGVVFGVLFMMMLTPMMNTMFKKAPKKKVVKKAPVKEGA